MTSFEATYKNLSKEVYKFEFGTFYFFEHIVVSEINEGVTLVFDNTKDLIQLINDTYQGRPFGYLSNRVNSYSVDPTGYYKVEEQFPNMAGFAVVYYSPFMQGTLKIEKLFLNAPFQGFDELNKAFDWLEYLVKSKHLDIA